MKIILSILFLMTLSSCQNDSGSDDIQKEEEFDRDDVIEKRNLPSPSEGKDFDIDRKIFDADDV